MFEWKFWRGAIERAIRSFAASLSALLLATGAFNAFNAEWYQLLGTAFGAAVISLLISMSVVNVGETGSASSIKEPQ